MKELKIFIPDDIVIDQDKSTFEKIQLINDPHIVHSLLEMLIGNDKDKAEELCNLRMCYYEWVSPEDRKRLSTESYWTPTFDGKKWISAFSDFHGLAHEILAFPTKNECNEFIASCGDGMLNQTL